MHLSNLTVYFALWTAYILTACCQNMIMPMASRDLRRRNRRFVSGRSPRRDSHCCGAICLQNSANPMFLGSQAGYAVPAASYPDRSPALRTDAMKPRELKMSDMYEQPGFLIRRAHQAATAAFAVATADIDLTPVQFASLIAIKDN